MKAVAQFSNPGEAQITICLTGTLTEFEALRKSLSEYKVPYWQTSALVDQISEAADKLRAKVTVKQPPEPQS